MTPLCIGLILLLCGCANVIEALNPEEEQQECLNAVSEELENEINEAYQRNIMARDIAVASERDRLGVEALKPSLLLGYSYSQFGYYLPEVDPFPESVLASGEDYDIREEGYQMNHGKMGMINIYETYPGSSQYFIVDVIAGDGMGGNGSAIAAETREYGLVYSTEVVDGNSWHSWHSSSANKIVRAVLNPETELKAEIAICGCGNWSEVASNDADVDAFSIGIFILPGEELPEILEEGSFSAKFKREEYRKTYVPAKGNTCQAPVTVC